MTFVVIGALLAMGGMAMPIVETGIALSVLFLGVFIALSKNIPINLAVICVALFAIFHGHVHGYELPVIASPTLYATGFVLSTTLLHIIGVLIGHYARKRVNIKHVALRRSENECYGFTFPVWLLRIRDFRALLNTA